MGEGSKVWQVIIAVIVSLGAFSAGQTIAWSSNITDVLKEGKWHDIVYDTDRLGWVGSLMTLGALVMCIPAGLLADTIGRKWTMLVCTIPLIIGWVCLVLGKYIWMVFLGRFLCGVGGGVFCVCAPVYTSEIAQTEIRGILGTFFQLFITLGILAGNVTGAFFSMTMHNIIGLAIPCLFFGLFFIQPETPIYLLKKGDAEGAAKSYKRLRGADYDASGETKIANDQIAKEQNMGSFVDGMKTKAAKRATVIMFMLMFYQQMSGVNAVMFYALDIFVDAGSTIKPAYCVIIIGVVQVVSTVCSTFTVDLFGRKILLLVSSSIMTVSCVMLGIFFFLKNAEKLDEDGLKKIGWLPVLSLNLFMIGFSLGIGPIPWAASPEIFPPEVVAKCCSAAATFNWLLAFLMTKGYPPIQQAIGNHTCFFIFAGVMFSCIFFVIFLMPETKGKSFAQIQEELGGA